METDLASQPTTRMSRSVVLLLLATIVLVQVGFRYPFTPHMMGTDSFFVIDLVNHVERDGYGAWLRSPWAYIGWYPQSYPSGWPVAVASLHQLTGLPLEAVVWIAAALLGVLASLGSWMAARLFIRDPRLPLLVALLYPTLPILITMTNWQLGTRGPLAALVPLVFWLLNSRKAAHIGMALALIPVLMTIHRSAIALVLIALIVLVHHARPVMLPRLSAALRKWAREVGLLLILGILGVILLPFTPFAPGPLSNLQWLREEAAVLLPTTLQGLGDFALFALYLLGRWGLAVALVIPGAYLLFTGRNKTSLEWMLIVMALLFAPFLAIAPYSTDVLAFLAATCATLVLLALLSAAGRPRALLRMRRWTCTLLIVGLLTVSAVSVSYRIANVRESIDYRNFVTADEYQTALYSRYAAYGMQVSNEGAAHARIIAIGGLPSTFDYLDPFLFPAAAEGTLWERLLKNPIAFAKNPFGERTYGQVTIDLYYLAWLDLRSGTAALILEKYDIRHATLKTWPGVTLAPFYDAVAAERYCIYRIGGFSTYAF